MPQEEKHPQRLNHHLEHGKWTAHSALVQDAANTVMAMVITTLPELPSNAKPAKDISADANAAKALARYPAQAKSSTEIIGKHYH